MLGLLIASGALACTIHVDTSGSASTGSTEAPEARPAGDDPGAATPETPAEADPDGKLATAETPEPGDAPTQLTADQFSKQILTMARAGDVAGFRGLIDVKSGLTLEGEAVATRAIDEALLGRITALDEGGPAPRVEVRCEPIQRKDAATCSLFQASATWTATLSRGADGTFALTALTRDP